MPKIFYSMLLLLGLVACSSSPEVTKLPERKEDSLSFKVERLNQQKEIQRASLLIVRFEPSRWRWVQTDPLGAPVARMILSANGWENDGFVMPNKQAEQLFSALATALNPIEPPFRFSRTEETPEGRDYVINGTFRWRIKQDAGLYHILLADKSLWRIEVLND